MSDDWDAFRDKVVNDPLWAADRLAELDAERAEFLKISHMHADLVSEMSDKLKAIEALRPPCPTCGGKGGTGIPIHACPDCVDGKVSIEQLVQRWLWSEELIVGRVCGNPAPHHEHSGPVGWHCNGVKP